MSRWRDTLILFGLVLVLGIYAWYISQPENASNDALPTAPAPSAATDAPVPLFPEAIGLNVSRVEIAGREALTPTTMIQDDLGAWYQTVPTYTQLVTTTISTQIATLSSLASRRVLAPDANPLAAYGLDDPAYEIILSADREDGTSVRYTLYVGNELTTSEGYYVQRKGDARVFIVAATTINALLDLPTAMPVYAPTPTPEPTPAFLPDDMSEPPSVITDTNTISDTNTTE